MLDPIKSTEEKGLHIHILHVLYNDLTNEYLLHLNLDQNLQRYLLKGRLA